MATTDETLTTPRPLRADARRNRARLLDAADAAFADHGTSASLEDVARRAGVGIGTLYRHFPTRDDLVEAVIHDGVEELVALADRLLDADDALAALRTWLRALVDHAVRYRGLATALVAAGCGGEGRLTDACHRQEAAADPLVARARSTGRLRDDVTTRDLLDLVSALAWLAEQGQRDAADERLLDLVLDGVRPLPPASG